MTFTDSKDGVKAMFEPNSGNGWEIECQGHQRVGLIVATMQMVLWLFRYDIFCVCFTGSTESIM